MKKETFPIPLNEKDLCSDGVLEALNDSWFDGSLSVNGMLHDYFTVDNTLWCMVYKYNCETFSLRPLDYDVEDHHETVIKRIERIVQDLNECNDDDYIRKVKCEWNGTGRRQMLVSFYYESKL